MTPVHFNEANRVFGAPDELSPEQVRPIHAFIGEAPRGSCEGAPLVVTAWKPDERELAALNAGHPVYLTCLGGLPPHFITCDFAEAINPS